jgi:hypothetical protein
VLEVSVELQAANRRTTKITRYEATALLLAGSLTD